MLKHQSVTVCIQNLCNKLFRNLTTEFSLLSTPFTHTHTHFSHLFLSRFALGPSFYPSPIFIFSISPDSDKNGLAPRKPQSGDRGETPAVAAVSGETDEAGAGGGAGARVAGDRAGRRRDRRAAPEPETAAERLEKRRGLGHGDAQTQPAQSEYRAKEGGNVRSFFFERCEFNERNFYIKRLLSCF